MFGGAELGELVALYGPWFLALMAFAETVFVTGVVVPSGLATSFAVALTVQGHSSLPEVAVASLGGGFLGDALGYWIGRRGGEALRERSGFVGSALRRYDRRGGRFVSGHPLFSVTGARLVAFVRTVMPVATGMSRLPFAVYLAFEVPGLLLWFAMYAGIGLLAGESIERAGAVVGGLWLVVFTLAGVTLWLRRRVRAAAKGRDEREAGPGAFAGGGEGP